MDRVTDPAVIVRGVLERVASWLQRIPKPDVETILVEDPRQQVFVLRRLGWHDRKRVDNTVTAVRVKNGKVWVEVDNTDLTIADELLNAGIAEGDIVLAFNSSELRKLSDFVIA